MRTCRSSVQLPTLDFESRSQNFYKGKKFKMNETLPSAAEEKELLDGDKEDQDGAVDAQAQMSEVLMTLTQVLTTMSTSMASMEKTVSQRLQREVEPPQERQKRSVELKQNNESDVSDSERLLQSTKPQVDTTKEGDSSVSDTRHEHDALLTAISQEFDQEKDIGPAINEQLAEFINKLWSAKLAEHKVKEKMEKYSRQKYTRQL